MSTREFTPIIVHNRSVNPAGTGTLANGQPENPVDYSSGNADGVRFHLAVLGVVGSATTWQLTCKFQIGKLDTTGAGLSKFVWYDLQAEQAAKLITEGVGWYGGAHSAPVGGASGVVADNTDTLPLYVSRAIKGFGRFPRCWIAVTATGASADFAVTYSLSAD